MKLLSFPELRSVKGIRYTRQWITEFVKTGRLPAPIRIGEATNAWVEREVDAWIAARINERDASRVAAE
jgi:prophage regulatory protein